MLMTWSKEASFLKTGAVSGEDCIDMTIVSIKGEIKFWETKDDSEPEGLSDKDSNSYTTTIVVHKRVKWPPLQVLQRNLGLHSIHRGFSIV
jgi:hypothetical protein